MTFSFQAFKVFLLLSLFLLWIQNRARVSTPNGHILSMYVFLLQSFMKSSCWLNCQNWKGLNLTKLNWVSKHFHFRVLIWQKVLIGMTLIILKFTSTTLQRQEVLSENWICLLSILFIREKAKKQLGNVNKVLNWLTRDNHINTVSWTDIISLYKLKQIVCNRTTYLSYLKLWWFDNRVS
jgi:hypothetical protein